MADNPTAPDNYKQWMRVRFPTLNHRIDGGASADLDALIAESLESCSAISLDAATEERERFTYVSMIHAALYHHKKRAAESELKLPDKFGTAMDAVESAMTILANTIGVEHRFLSVFYLFYNP